MSPLRLPKLRISEEDLVLAKKLRRAVWRTASALVGRSAPKASDVHLINRWGRQPRLVHELARGAESMRWRQPTIEAALATVADDAILLFGEPTQRKRMRRCENSGGCRVIFYDDWRPGVRRWCASNRCGDRIRARRYRQRHQAAKA